MRIAVNARLLLPNKMEGIGFFAYETIKIITSQHPEVEFYFLFDRKPHPDFIFSANVKPIVLFPQARHPFLYYIWFEYSVKKALEKIKPDLFLSPDGYLCLGTDIPSIAVIHDLNFEHYPENLPFLERLYYKYFFQKFARKANRIATVSQYSKKDLVDSYGISADKIDVVYNAVRKSFFPINEEKKKKVRNEISDGQDYFVYIGSIHERKNIKNLLLAFDHFKERTSASMKLVLAGSFMWKNNKINGIYKGMKHKSDVVFTGRLSNEKLNEVLGSAYALTFVPIFEGFGVPVLEAFACDVPVITSNSTSLPEVAGDAAILVDPHSVAAISEGMELIVKDLNLKNSLIENGRKKKSEFSWEKTSESLWISIEKVIRSATK